MRICCLGGGSKSIINEKGFQVLECFFGLLYNKSMPCVTDDYKLGLFPQMPASSNNLNSEKQLRLEPVSVCGRQVIVIQIYLFNL